MPLHEIENFRAVWMPVHGHATGRPHAERADARTKTGGARPRDPFAARGERLCQAMPEERGIPQPCRDGPAAGNGPVGTRTETHRATDGGVSAPLFPQCEPASRPTARA